MWKLVRVTHQDFSPRPSQENRLLTMYQPSAVYNQRRLSSLLLLGGVLPLESGEGKLSMITFISLLEVPDFILSYQPLLLKVSTLRA